MDQWYLELFTLISKQKDTAKVNMLLPELYNEFDLLLRAENYTELLDIYDFVREKNPIDTIDEDFNELTYIKLKKEIIKQLIILNDYSVLEKEIKELLNLGKSQAIKDYIAIWEDNPLVLNFLQEIINYHKKPKTKKEPIEPVVDIVEPEIETLEDNINTTEFNEKESNFEANLEPKKIVVSEPIKPTPEIILKKHLNKPIKKVVKKVEKDFKPLPEAIDLAKPEPETDKVTDSPPKSEQAEDLTHQFVDTLISKYNVIINKEKLFSHTKIDRILFSIVKDFVDERDRDRAFFIELFNFFRKYNMESLITYVAEKSITIKKLCHLNIGLINEVNLDSKFDLLDILEGREIDFFKDTLNEREMRLYIDNLIQRDEIADDLIRHASTASIYAPRLSQTFVAIDAINYLKENVKSIQHTIIDIENPVHLYWTMILAACLGIYVVRKDDVDFIECMKCVSVMAVQLIGNINDPEIGLIIKTQAKSYVRRIYAMGMELPEYESWWGRKKDDMLNAKLNAISILNEVS